MKFNREFGFALAAAAVGIDAWWGDIRFAFPAVAGMCFLALSLGPGKGRYALRAGRRSVRFALSLVMVSFLAARAYVLTRQVADVLSPDSHAALSVVRLYDTIFLTAAIAAFVLMRSEPGAWVLLLRLAQRPYVLLVGSFGLTIGIGTLLLTLPVSVSRVDDVSFVDSLFTMTSAVCVTGLLANDFAGTYTWFGHLAVLAGIQLGGLGMMTMTALAATVRSESSIRARSQYATMLEARSLSDLRSLVWSVVGYTLILELAGALTLWLMWAGDSRFAGSSVGWLAVFHSVSAFCNAGFSLFHDNLLGARSDFGVQAVIMTLVVLGGLGFPVLRELAQRSWALVGLRRGRKRPPRARLTLASRVALLVSATLLVCGAAAVSLLEAGNLLAPFDLAARLMAALFTSVSARTAGFNTVEVGAFQPSTLLVLMLLMFVGGSSGSTAGGIKVTTIAVLFAALRSELQGREPQLSGRAIAPENVRRAAAVASISGLIVISSLMLLTTTETHSFLSLAFEAVSAFATVGLSTGITDSLSTPGKLVLIATMFVGRVGPLTIAAAIGRTRRRPRVRLAAESLPIG
jgi:trk system potassium uptake protein TrkH